MLRVSHEITDDGPKMSFVVVARTYSFFVLFLG